MNHTMNRGIATILNIVSSCFKPDGDLGVVLLSCL
jgi:hypothetical protein